VHTLLRNQTQNVHTLDNQYGLTPVGQDFLQLASKFNALDVNIRLASPLSASIARKEDLYAKSRGIEQLDFDSLAKALKVFDFD
jgi:hypothetical protein